MQRFKQIDFWIFDLDNTLYPAGAGIVQQMHDRALQFVMEHLRLGEADARRLRAGYQARYGTTLRGLMQDHKMAPERFLEFVHDVDLSGLAMRPDLKALMARLRGRKIVFTNGPRKHATRVLERLGLADVIEDVHDIAVSDYMPKPSPEPYQRLMERARLSPRCAAMFEDQAHNLAPAHAAGMLCIWVAEQGARLPQHVHFAADDLESFLKAVLDAVLLERRHGEEPAALPRVRPAATDR